MPVVQALFVTFLWATSWVLIKIGLEDVPSLTFAGLRYALAFACLVIVAGSRRSVRASLRRLERRDWTRLAWLGLLLYAATQGAQFVAIDLVADVNVVSLALSFTPVVVAFIGVPLLDERATPRQWTGVAIFLIGAALYLRPAAIGHPGGLVAALVGLAANAGAAVLGRDVNREVRLPAISITLTSMGIGAVVLLATGVVVQGLPPLPVFTWLIIAWLAIVNTAFAFTLWNHTLRRLSAVESSVVNNTMLIQIAILAWLFLDQPLGLREVVALGLAAAGVLMVQLGAPRPVTR